jgi:hypothetical protein
VKEISVEKSTYYIILTIWHAGRVESRNISSCLVLEEGKAKQAMHQVLKEQHNYSIIL